MGGREGPVEIGRFTFTKAEIVRFALAFDPQPFHVDEAAAAASPFGGLVASGWHTACVWMGLFVRANGAVAGLAPDHPAVLSPVGVGFGMTDLKWLAPVRAGDTIVFFTEVLEARPSGSRPGWTIFHRRNSARREDGTQVLTFELKHMAPGS
ncbi:MaoC/PaaZ C-terminal domain-containing protein [Xanthobacter autotrophicus]|uniref:MaoC/PaaZ C-terminal domain-containing protein n=1 Tax=Xanthobacter autotrophicus TaxID=280 RepID=UPI0037267645